ncbi:hypothetical protein F5B22DRAFT_600745 [Xylaria bambusicola]|uniref:uncharacterized protein n=1 Tax=Xylaria bambusicola TaxID=326684 RepID=UPI0020080675|nr:uncharacterized protein F5B22DRAFT_600745 [Xylaria bambusicola]KAI0518319.1 hypothetical protein F5B22DRAFT_600745 [Xylaria bambusicola]
MDLSSSTRAGTSTYSSSSSYDPLREYRLSESTSRSDATERFFVTGKPSRSEDSMARQMKQWDRDWSKVSSRR